MVPPAFDFRNNDHARLLATVFVVVIVFHLLSRSEAPTVLAILVLMLGAGAYYAMGGSEPAKSEVEASIEERMKKNDRTATPSTSYYIKSFPVKGLKYLEENDRMLSIAKNLKFLRVFDRARYEDMLLLMDRLQKVYMYILVGRYDCKQGLNTLMDLRELLLKTLYSFYIILPMKTKHMYGLDPHKELDGSIQDATRLTRHMITVLENYAYRECKTPYLDSTSPLAVDPMGCANSVP